MEEGQPESLRQLRGQWCHGESGDFLRVMLVITFSNYQGTGSQQGLLLEEHGMLFPKPGPDLTPSHFNPLHHPHSNEHVFSLLDLPRTQILH